MKNVTRIVVLFFCLIPFVSEIQAAPQAPPGTITLTVSMDRPEAHYFHVVCRCEGLKGETQDFKMPVWTPGYYQIMDYPRNVINFRASDAAGNPLVWDKTSKNTWRVNSGRAATIVVSYDVYAFARFVAESFLDDSQGFISPAGLFMHPAGQIQHPVTVLIKPCPGWTTVSTGLEPVAGQPFTFSAPDFDALYDCPILVGNQEVLSFEVRGIPHQFVGRSLGNFDRSQFVSDLTRMIESAASLMGDIPYRHYTFISIGPGRGGLEHANSVALSFDASELETPEGRRRWLGFVCHEYFHLYNVKRIRPIALGPFDYDRENYTHLLWVSEGITVYYEHLILNRAGLLSRNEVFRELQSDIQGYENRPGHLFQSASASSFDTWLQSYTRTGNAANTTISYYDKGAALGLLLDLKIRNETQNRKSLDDVMRTLYRQYYQEQKRGFTDQEFRRVCENAAGCSLAEIFDVYASTTRDIDYTKYLGLAGLNIDVEYRARPSAWLGATTRDENGKVIVSNIEWNSPAAEAGGLSVLDEVIGLDGIRVDSQKLGKILDQKEPGDRVTFLVSRGGVLRQSEVLLGKKMERSFSIAPLPNPTPLQAAILRDWLR